MQKNLRFLIYRLQDPKLMAEKYMSLGSILRRKTTKKCDDNLAPEQFIADSDEEDVTSSSDECFFKNSTKIAALQSFFVQKH